MLCSGNSVLVRKGWGSAMVELAALEGERDRTAPTRSMATRIATGPGMCIHWMLPDERDGYSLDPQYR